MMSYSEMKPKLDNRWIRDVKDKEEREKVIQRIVNTLNSDPTLKQLKEIIDEELRKVERHEVDLEAYDSPSWSHRQAHNNGHVGALLSIRKLLTI